MKNKVSKSEQPVPKNKEMNDSDYLNDLLSTAKSIVHNYAIVMSETSNDDLYNQYIKLFKDTQDCQRKLFNLQFQKGWYKLEEAEEQKVNTVLNEHVQKLKELE